MSAQNYYHWALEELRFKPNMTKKDIKTRYRKLAKKYHPDLNPKIDVERFKAISNVYNDIISGKIQISTFPSKNLVFVTLQINNKNVLVLIKII